MASKGGEVAGDGEGAGEAGALGGPVAADDDLVVLDLGGAVLGVEELHEAGGVGVLVVVELDGGALGAAVEAGDAGALAEGLDADDEEEGLDLGRAGGRSGR